MQLFSSLLSQSLMFPNYYTRMFPRLYIFSFSSNHLCYTLTCSHRQNEHILFHCSFPTRFRFSNPHYNPTQTNTWHCSRFKFQLIYSAGAFLHSHYKWIQDSNQWCGIGKYYNYQFWISDSCQKHWQKTFFNFLDSFHRATCRIHLDYHALLSWSLMTGKNIKINCHQSAWPIRWLCHHQPIMSYQPYQHFG